MKKIINLLFVCSTFGFAQEYDGCLQGSHKNISISYASILNKTNNIYTFSDEFGKFSISAKEKYTLVISNINYLKKEYFIIDITNKGCILLKPKYHKLEEVVISSSKKKRKKIGYKKGRKYHRLGLSLNTTYALRIRNTIKYNLLKIELPVFYDKNFEYNNQGVISLQLFRYVKNKSFKLAPISDKYYSEIKENRKNLVFEIDKTIILPKEDFFIVFSRIIPDNSFNSNYIYSVNPSLFFRNKGKRGDLYVKNIISNKWVDFQEYLKEYRSRKTPSPLFCFQLTVKEIAN